MFIFSRNFWLLHKLILESKFPNGPPRWARIILPVVWVAYCLWAIPVNLVQRIRRKTSGPFPSRQHLLRLNHAAIIERGGDYYGDHVLLKCPECGTPVLHDGEHDYFYPDVSNLSNRQSVGGNDEACACIKCGFLFTGRMIWDCFNGERSARDFLISKKEAQTLGLSWMLDDTVHSNAVSR